MRASRVLLGSSLLALGTAAYAVQFDNTTGGPQVATVGTNGDYASLAAAATAFNAVTGGINRPWTLEIQNDLTEAANVGFANTFGAGASLTIKPAASTTPKVTFTDLSTPPGTAVFGHLVLGSSAINASTPTPDATNTPSSVNAYIIDGSNTPNGTTRDLTFAVGETVAFVSPTNHILRIAGDTDGVVVKNANFIFNDTAGSYAAIGLAGGTIGGNPVVPDNVVIENNDIRVGQLAVSTPAVGANAFGIQTTLAAISPAPATGVAAVQGLTVRNNVIRARQRGTFMNGTGSATIEGNEIILAGTTATGLTLGGIFHLNSNGVSGWTQTYNANTVTTLNNPVTAAAQGTIPIFIDSGPTSGTYTITNNIVNGPIATSTVTTPVDLLIRGINIGSATSNYLVEHNSISIPATNASGATANRVGGITAPSALSGNAVIRNNIIRMAETDGLSAAISSAQTSNIVSEGNLLFVAAGGRVGRIGTTNYDTMADWRGAGFDLVATGSQFVDPATTIPNWNVDTLRFPGQPIAGINAVASSTILFDIDGAARPATGAFPGAQEPGPLAASAQDWGLFE
jgi:hypothetical protein